MEEMEKKWSVLGKEVLVFRAGGEVMKMRTCGSFLGWCAENISRRLLRNGKFSSVWELERVEMRFSKFIFYITLNVANRKFGFPYGKLMAP